MAHSRQARVTVADLEHDLLTVLQDVAKVEELATREDGVRQDADADLWAEMDGLCPDAVRWEYVNGIRTEVREGRAD